MRSGLVRVDEHWTIDDVRRSLLAHARDATLVVDTFPGGIAHELDDALLDAFAERVLVRRYLRPGSYDDEERLASRFNRTLIPYAPERCEWEGAIEGEYVGPLVREVPVRGEPEDLVVIGDGVPAGWMPLLARARFVSGPLAVLPRARRYLATAAGHNLTYELLALGMPFASVPQDRRYDDQFRRADLLGIGIHHKRDLVRWLEATCSACTI
jgi:hypothetical protein